MSLQEKNGKAMLKIILMLTLMFCDDIKIDADDAQQVIEEESCRCTVPEDRGPQGRRNTKVEGQRCYPVQTHL